MKAFMCYASGLKHPIKTNHSNVIEIPKTNRCRRMQCLDCGSEWIENLHSPTIVSDEHFENFKDDYIPCNK